MKILRIMFILLLSKVESTTYGKNEEEWKSKIVANDLIFENDDKLDKLPPSARSQNDYDNIIESDEKSSRANSANKASWKDDGTTKNPISIISKIDHEPSVKPDRSLIISQDFVNQIMLAKKLLAQNFYIDFPIKQDKQALDLLAKLSLLEAIAKNTVPRETQIIANRPHSYNIKDLTASYGTDDILTDDILFCKHNNDDKELYFLASQEDNTKLILIKLSMSKEDFIKLFFTLDENFDFGDIADQLSILRNYYKANLKNIQNIHPAHEDLTANLDEDIDFNSPNTLSILKKIVKTIKDLEANSNQQDNLAQNQNSTFDLDKFIHNIDQLATFYFKHNIDQLPNIAKNNYDYDNKDLKDTQSKLAETEIFKCLNAMIDFINDQRSDFENIEKEFSNLLNNSNSEPIEIELSKSDIEQLFSLKQQIKKEDGQLSLSKVNKVKLIISNMEKHTVKRDKFEIIERASNVVKQLLLENNAIKSDNAIMQEKNDEYTNFLYGTFKENDCNYIFINSIAGAFGVNTQTDQVILLDLQPEPKKIESKTSCKPSNLIIAAKTPTKINGIGKKQQP